MEKELLKEIIEACVVAIDLLGIDVKQAFPNLYKEIEDFKKLDKKLIDGVLNADI